MISVTLPGRDGSTVRSGTCRLDGLLSRPSVPHMVDRAHWTRARRRLAGFGGRAPGQHAEALGNMMGRRWKIGQRIAALTQNAGSGGIQAGGQGGPA